MPPPAWACTWRPRRRRVRSDVMIPSILRALRKPWNAVEIFIAGNLAFLAADVYVAHAVNAFERRLEWIPVFFSLIAPVLLITAALIRGRAGRALALLVG